MLFLLERVTCTALICGRIRYLLGRRYHIFSWILAIVKQTFLFCGESLISKRSVQTFRDLIFLYPAARYELKTWLLISIAIAESETAAQQESTTQKIVTTDSCFQKKWSKENFLTSPTWTFQCLPYSILCIYRREPIIHKEQKYTTSLPQQRFRGPFNSCSHWLCIVFSTACCPNCQLLP